MHGPRGHIALQYGGAIARIARETIADVDFLRQFDEAMYDDGDCLWDGRSEFAYWHEFLGEHEPDLVCGVYNVGTGVQNKHPLSPSGFNRIQWYRKREGHFANNVFIPATTTRWRKNMRFQHKMMESLEGYEHVAQDIIENAHQSVPIGLPCILATSVSAKLTTLAFIKTLSGRQSLIEALNGFKIATVSSSAFLGFNCILYHLLPQPPKTLGRGVSTLRDTSALSPLGTEAEAPDVCATGCNFKKDPRLCTVRLQRHKFGIDASHPPSSSSSSILERPPHARFHATYSFEPAGSGRYISKGSLDGEMKERNACGRTSTKRVRTRRKFPHPTPFPTTAQVERKLPNEKCRIAGGIPAPHACTPRRSKPVERRRRRVPNVAVIRDFDTAATAATIPIPLPQPSFPPRRLLPHALRQELKQLLSVLVLVQRQERHLRAAGGDGGGGQARLRTPSALRRSRGGVVVELGGGGRTDEGAGAEGVDEGDVPEGQVGYRMRVETLSARTLRHHMIPSRPSRLCQQPSSLFFCDLVDDHHLPRPPLT
ncbi:hypothetical protein B0H16DRAFT_1740936 [Mycena metata]|uniref:Uncharacterized protein n=1 Tax=Mycena metata TaxID=1033252 RepID=A0AAD7HBC4_9AGAR|nr:hypothetical protein B0H16DRAFT_1740936 [Mycena metata]